MLVPLAVFVGVAVWYFAGLQTFDFLALTAGALIGLLVGSLFARSQESYPERRLPWGGQFLVGDDRDDPRRRRHVRRS